MSEEGKGKPDIEGIRKRCEAATPGPWKIDSAWSIPKTMVRTGPNVNDFLQANKCADNIFIAHARQDIPMLLDRIKELQEQLESAHHDEAVFGDHNLIPSAEAEVESLRAKLAAAEGVIRDYGDHLASCDKLTSYDPSGKKEADPCSCGFFEIITELTTTSK